MGAFDTLFAILPQNECYDVLTKDLINGDGSLDKLIDKLKKLKEEREAMLNGVGGVGNVAPAPRLPQITANEFIAQFTTELTKVLNGNNNISKKDIADFINYITNSTAEVIDPNKSFITANKIFTYNVLYLLTTKCKIEKTDIVRIIEIILKEKYLYSLNPEQLFWIDNLIQTGSDVPKNHISKLKKFGYNENFIKFINRYDQQMENIFADNKLRNLCSSIDLVKLIVTDNRISTNIIKNLNNCGQKLTKLNFDKYIEVLFDKYSYKLRTDKDLKNHSHQFYNLVNFFDKCGYLFTSGDFHDLLLDDDSYGHSHYNDIDNKIVWTTIKSQIFYNETSVGDLTSIINFFADKKIYLNLKTIFDSCMTILIDSLAPDKISGYLDRRDKMEHVFYEFFQRVNFLTTHHLIKKSDNESNNYILTILKQICLMPNKFIEKYAYISHLHLANPDTIKLKLRQYFNVENSVVYDAELVKFAICTNDTHLINLYVSSCPTALTTYQNGLRFACINLNSELIDFYLNSKFNPTQYDALCLIKSTLFTMKDSYDKKLETLGEILGKFALFGFKMDEDVYKVLCSIKKIDQTKFESSFKHLGKDKIAAVKKLAKPTKNIEVSLPARKLACNQFNTLEGATYLFKITNLQMLISLYDKLNFKMSTYDIYNKEHYRTLIGQCLEYNYYPNVFEYFAEEFKYNPPDAEIELCPNNTIKEIIRLRCKYVQYTEKQDDATVAKQVVIQPTIELKQDENKHNKHDEDDEDEKPIKIKKEKKVKKEPKTKVNIKVFNTNDKINKNNESMQDDLVDLVDF